MTGAGIKITYDDAPVRGALERIDAFANSDARGAEWGSNVVYAGLHQTGGTIHREAHTGHAFRKVSKSGKFSGFTKERKANFGQSFHVGAYDIHMPARPYLGIDSDDEKEFDAITARHVQAVIDGSGGADPAYDLYDAIGAAGVTSTQLRFRSGVGPGGIPWKPSERVEKHGGQTLVLSRRLLDSQTHNVLRGAA